MGRAVERLLNGKVSARVAPSLGVAQGRYTPKSGSARAWDRVVERLLDDRVWGWAVERLLNGKLSVHASPPLGVAQARYTPKSGSTRAWDRVVERLLDDRAWGWAVERLLNGKLLEEKPATYALTYASQDVHWL